MQQQPLQIRVLNQLAAVERMLSAWDALWERCHQATTFQRPEWLYSWMQVFWPSEPLVLEVRSGDRLVGFAPFLIYPSGHDRVLALMGGGASDYLDVLVDPALKQEVVAAIWSHLQLEAAKWDRVEFTDLPRSSPILESSAEAWELDTTAHNVCPVLNLPASAEDLRKVVPSHQMRNLRNARARLSRMGGSDLEIANCHSWPAILDAVICLHQRRWSKAGRTGVLADPAVQSFHHRVAPRLLRKGILRLYGLRACGRYIAALYALLDRGVAYYYLQGFDPSVAPVSPGTQILGAVIEDALRCGARRVDMLRGSEAYKYQWGAHDEPTFCLRAQLKIGRALVAA